MELKILSPTADGFIKAIDWNYEEIKAEMSEKVADYKMMVYSDDQIKEAKKDRAELNKLVKTLEDKRKEIKSLCLAPYEKFEKQMKELVSVVNEPISVIDEQIKAYEDEQRQKKIAEIKAYYDSKSCEIELDKFYDKKWENVSTSMSSIKEAIDKKCDEIEADMKILADETEYQFEAVEAYKNTLDIRYALNEIKRLKELAQRKSEYELFKSAQSEKTAQDDKTITEDDKVSEIANTEATEASEDNFIPDFAQIGDNRHWLTIKAHVDTANHAELIAYLDEKQIEYTIL